MHACLPLLLLVSEVLVERASGDVGRPGEEDSTPRDLVVTGMDALHECLFNAIVMRKEEKGCFHSSLAMRALANNMISVFYDDQWMVVTSSETGQNERERGVGGDSALPGCMLAGSACPTRGEVTWMELGGSAPGPSAWQKREAALDRQWETAEGLGLQLAGKVPSGALPPRMEAPSFQLSLIVSPSSKKHPCHRSRHTSPKQRPSSLRHAGRPRPHAGHILPLQGALPTRCRIGRCPGCMIKTTHRLSKACEPRTWQPLPASFLFPHHHAWPWPASEAGCANMKRNVGLRPIASSQACQPGTPRLSL